MKDQARLHMATPALHDHGDNDRNGGVRLASTIDGSVSETP